MRFATDATLGKLGRYLRVAGFDTLCQHQSRHGDVFWSTLDDQRVILTRTRALASRLRQRHLIFVRDNDPLKQVRQVIADVGITQDDLKPLSRCLDCNTTIRQVDKWSVKGRVPAYVWHHQQSLNICGQCQRIYWPGSHHDRMCSRLTAIFNNSEERTHEH
jgi:uncharacterized protein with PIN domain